MLTSTETDKIDAALGRVQAEMGMVARNKGVEVEGKTTKFATKFVTIAALYEACRDLLTKEGITIWQGGGFENGGGERLYTRLSHAGQWLVSSFPVKAREGAQNFGGGIAFARRWGLAGAVGIFPADDADEKHGYDAARAEGRTARRSPAPVGIAAACSAIRDARAEQLVGIIGRARGDFPRGEEAKAVDREIDAWFEAELGAVVDAQALVALRELGRAAKPKGSSVREALLAAEQRVKS